MDRKQSSFDSMEGFVTHQPSCPISGERLNEQAVRFVAWITVILLTIFLLIGARWIPFFLLIDL